MRIISFDIGIKNMAYCIFNVDKNNETTPTFSIVEWKTVNLMNEEDTIKPTIFTCSCNNKSKKGGNNKCSRNALYMKSVDYIPIFPVHRPVAITIIATDPATTTTATTTGSSQPFPSSVHSNSIIHYFCEKHAKETTEWLLPNKSHTAASLNKRTIEELQTECIKYSCMDASKTLKKKTMVDLLVKYFKEKTFEPVQYKKQKNSKETDLISIGYNLRRELDKIPSLETITNVIIENQISTLAARMNSIQGMLVQYFIMKENGERKVSIEFISSSNKLKGLPAVVEAAAKEPVVNMFINTINNLDDKQGNRIQTKPVNKKQVKETKETNETNETKEGENTPPSEKEQVKTSVHSKYKAHKKDGLYHCSLFLDNNPILREWKHVLNTKKKDDYADCFLQGVWYMKHHHLVKEKDNYILEV
jgi:hypothetical protein